MGASGRIIFRSLAPKRLPESRRPCDFFLSPAQLPVSIPCTPAVALLWGRATFPRYLPDAGVGGEIAATFFLRVAVFLLRNQSLRFILRLRSGNSTFFQRGSPP